LIIRTPARCRSSSKGTCALRLMGQTWRISRKKTRLQSDKNSTISSRRCKGCVMRLRIRNLTGKWKSSRVLSHEWIIIRLNSPSKCSKGMNLLKISHKVITRCLLMANQWTKRNRCACACNRIEKVRWILAVWITWISRRLFKMTVAKML